MVNEPDAIGGATEDEARAMHFARADVQQNRFSVTTGDLQSDFCFGRKVDVMARHLLQTALADRIEKARGCAMVKYFGRTLRRVLEVHLNGMTLAGANSLTIVAESEALFVVGGDDVLELLK